MLSVLVQDLNKIFQTQEQHYRCLTRFGSLIKDVAGALSGSGEALHGNSPCPGKGMAVELAEDSRDIAARSHYSEF